MDMPLISVVVPVFKVEPYIKRCVDSIINQTYYNLEIILVDDGSPDNCPIICDEYAQKDKRVRVLHKKNGGLSEARNAGTNIALGKYISYIDSDDLVAPDYIEYLYGLITKWNTCISICRVMDCEDKVLIGDGKREEMVLNSAKALEMMFYQCEFTTSASGKLYLLELMRQFQFPVGRKHEDLMTVYKILFESTPVAYGQRQLYYYMHRDGSIMTAAFSSKSLDLKYAADDIYEFVKKNCPSALRAARSRKFSCYCQLLAMLPSEEVHGKLGTELWSWILENRMDILKDNNARKKNRLAALCTIFGTNLFRKISNIHL